MISGDHRIVAEATGGRLGLVGVVQRWRLVLEFENHAHLAMTLDVQEAVLSSSIHNLVEPL